MIETRVLDGLFDDPIRLQRVEKKERISAEELMDFTKSKKGLGELYEDEYNQEFLGANANEEDDQLKTEITELMSKLDNMLNRLSHEHFIPKQIDKEAVITTQNVEAFQMEEAVEFGQHDQTEKTKFKGLKSMVSDQELSKAEKKAGRAKRKRHIRAHLKKREVKQMEKKRENDLPMLDKFETKQMEKHLREKKKQNEKNAVKGKVNYFEKMQEVQKTDEKNKRSKHK